MANEYSNTVSVFLNQGNGTFTSTANYTLTTGYQPVSVAIGDLNSDGKPDLAVANVLSNTISVFLNQGNGTFPSTANYTYTSGNYPLWVAIGDLNGDGYAILQWQIMVPTSLHFSKSGKRDVCGSV